MGERTGLGLVERLVLQTMARAGRPKSAARWIDPLRGALAEPLLRAEAVRALAPGALALDAKLELELAQLEPEERALFMAEMGIVDLGRGIYMYNGVNHAARELARVTSVHLCGTSGAWDTPTSRTPRRSPSKRFT